MKRITLLILACAIGLVPVIAAAQEDQVIGEKGTPTRGTIKKISPTTVTVNVGGIDRNFDVKEIRKVSFGADPPELQTGRNRALEGQYEDALTELNKIDVASLQHPGVKQDVDYYKAYCLAKLALTEGGDKTAAGKQMYAFVSQNSESYHFFEAAVILGDLLMATGNYDNAAAFYGKLSDAPWPDYKMRAVVLEGNSLVSAGKHAAALPKFQQVLNSGLNTPDAIEQKNHARVGSAVCMAASGQHEEGIQLIEDLIAKNDPNDMELFGRAYNALGACYAKAGKTKDALLAYLHTDVLFYGDPDVHAEALYHLSKLWGDVNKSDRAVRARSILTSRYPGSRWATMK